MSSPLHRLSASQIETYRQCPRKWAWRYIEGHREEPAGSALLGTRVHEILESYLIHGTRPDLSERMTVDVRGKGITYWPGQIATSGLHLLPPPGTVKVEGEFRFDTEVGPWGGRLDGEYTDLAGRGRLVILDHKTTSDRRWTKDLTADVQCNLYAHAKLLENPELDSVLARWIYYLTAGSRRDAWVVERVMEREHVARQMESIHATALEIHEAYRRRPAALSLAPNTSACGSYGGCPHRSRCGDISAVDLIFVGGDDVIDDNFAAFLDEEEKKKKALTGVPPLPSIPPIEAPAKVAPRMSPAPPPLPAAPLVSLGQGAHVLVASVPWEIGDPLNAAQEYLLDQGKPWSVVASAADCPPNANTTQQFDLLYLPGLPLTPRPEAGVINPPEAPERPAASPEEMPPVAPKRDPKAERAALKARAIELGLVTASTKLSTDKIAAMVAEAEARPGGAPQVDVIGTAQHFLSGSGEIVMHTPPRHDPVLDALEKAPLDDEPFTEEDEEAVREGREAAKRGDVLTTDELRKRLDLDGYTLYINCSPDHFSLTLDHILREIVPVFREKEKVSDYRLLPYGEGSGKIVSYLDLYLDDKKDMLTDIVVDSRTPEGALCLSTLSRRAARLVRGFW